MHTGVVGTVGVIEGLYIESVITSLASIEESVAAISYLEGVCVCIRSALGCATYGTGLCCDTRRNGVRVTGSCNSLLSLKNYLTYRTLLTSGKTGCSTSRSSRCESFLGMTCRISEVTVFELVTVSVITSVNGVTAFSTCGRYNVSCNKVTIVEVGATYCTYVVLIKGMSGSCINYVLGVEYLATNGAVGNYIVRTCVYTVGSNNVFISGSFGVTESCAFGKATSGTGLGSFTGSGCPNVLMLLKEPLAALLSAEVNVVKREAGAGSSPTAHVEAVDIKVLDRLACAVVSEVKSVGVAEVAVDVVANLKSVISHLDEHLNVYELVTGNGSEYVGGNGLTVDVEGAVTVRLYRKNVNGVTVP